PTRRSSDLAKFNAGSVVRRTSSLLAPHKGEMTMAFVDPRIKGAEIQIATAFHLKREEKPRVPGLSPMVASLINNPTPDILASAYAPPEPDFARASPFASVLREDNYLRGRFVPPATEDEHAWVRQPLPKHVFSENEQRCLTAGIYFEAR